MVKGKRPRKPMTEDQKRAKREREKKRYQAARRAGLTPEQAKSIRKTLENTPELVEDASDALLELAGQARGLADWIEKRVATLMDAQKATDGKTSSKKSRKPRRTDYSDFDDFVRRRPNMPAREVIKEYRRQGGRIGTEKGAERVRQVRGKEKDVSKINRIRYYSNQDKPIFGDHNKYLIKARYMYLMQYEVMREGQPEPYTDWMYVSSNRKLTMSDLRAQVQDIFSDGYEQGKEKYRALYIVPGSITLIHAVDTTL